MIKFFLHLSSISLRINTKVSCTNKTKNMIVHNCIIDQEKIKTLGPKKDRNFFTILTSRVISLQLKIQRIQTILFTKKE